MQRSRLRTSGSKGHWNYRVAGVAWVRKFASMQVENSGELPNRDTGESRPMPRLFTGLEIPAELAESLSLLRGGLPGARWIDRENYHLTLRFIGDVDDEVGSEVAWLLGKVRRREFELQLDGLSAVGGRRPRAVVVTVAPSPSVMELQAEHE